MTDKILKDKIVRWATQIGRKEAIKRMVMLDISPTMAERLAKGTYDPKPHVDTVAKICTEMAKDGVKLAG